MMKMVKGYESSVEMECFKWHRFEVSFVDEENLIWDGEKGCLIPICPICGEMDNVGKWIKEGDEMKHAREDYNRIQDLEGKIPEDEPVFLIRGQDEVGATIVFIWALLNQLVGGDRRLTELAMFQSDRMVKWPKKKKADL